MKTLYKVLTTDKTSPYRGFKYRLKKKYHCADFDTDKDVACSNGFYATDIDGLPYAFRHQHSVYRCEVWGQELEIDQFKRRYKNIRLLELVSHEEIKQLAGDWEAKVGYKLSEALFPANPLLLPKKEPTDADIQLLKQWASVRASVGDSVWASVGASVGDSVRASVGDSVWASVRASVGASVGDSVWASVRASVGDSVWAYIGSLFPNIKTWKYIKHKKGIYPFQPCVDLWYRGLVPSFDGSKWRLHSGANTGIVWEGKL